ncbi:MAG: hypothetical protein EOP04_18395 [Proteobacteria bacterium]|nr:MAG: hypothetical protein EOP04_18395 [Pseudomonadota bacterium]
MARETKQDRIVRSISDQVAEHLHELKTIEANPNNRENDVEVWIQSFLKNCLGYMSSSGHQIRAQDTKGKMRPDLIVYKHEKPTFVVEVKKIGFDLGKSDFRSGKTQLFEYLSHIGGVKWGLLSNGHEWRLYDFSQPGYGGIEIFSFDLRNESDVIDLNKKAIEELCYDLYNLHEASYSTEAWDELSKEALAFSPESLSRAILSNDVVRLISRIIRGEHDFKANQEVLTDKIYELIENGLDDSIPGWNETKQAEFHKYIKSQKRASRKTKRSSKAQLEVETLAGTPEGEVKTETVVAVELTLAKATS